MDRTEWLEEITQRHIQMQERSRNIPDEGIVVSHHGREFIVYRNVFLPFDDSLPLVENYTINPGERVLDVFTGSGAIAVHSAYLGAREVVALDINPNAIRSTEENARRHGFEEVISARKSDVLSELDEEEKFDVITANPPFRNKYASDLVQANQWDSNFNANRVFFEGIGKHLVDDGRVYISQANFGEVDLTKRLADEAGFSIEEIGRKIFPERNPREFYAFELRRK